MDKMNHKSNETNRPSSSSVLLRQSLQYGQENPYSGSLSVAKDNVERHLKLPDIPHCYPEVIELPKECTKDDDTTPYVTLIVIVHPSNFL